MIDELTSLVTLALSLGTVNRRTEHPDGMPESDTTHTVMLALSCWYLNDTLGLHMDNGLLVQLALVHDLHEAICGDECTLRQNPTALAQKREREAGAIGYVQTLPSIGSMAWTYHRQQRRESRFIRAVDKLLPKLTHLLNGAVVLRAENMSREEFHDAIMVRQYADMESYCSDLPEILELHRQYGKLVEDLL